MGDFWRAFLLAKNQWLRRTIAIAAMLVDAVTLILLPLVLAYIFDSLADAGGQVGLGVRWLVLMAVIRAVAIYLEVYFQEGTGNHIGRVIRQMLFRRLLQLPFSFFDKRKTGDLMSVMTKDVEAVQDGTGWVIMLVFINGIIGIGIVAAMLYLHIPTALIVLGCLPVLAAVAIFYSRSIEPMYQKVQAQSGRLHTAAQENISGIKVVKAFGRQVEQADHFAKENKGLYQAHMAIARLNSIIHPSLESLSIAIPLITIGAGGYYVIQGDLTIGSLVAFLSFTEFLIWPIRQITWLAELCQRAIAGARRIYGVLDEPVPSMEGKYTGTAPNGEIFFENVHFQYQGDELAISNFSLQVQAGETVCLIGMTGSGKTTIANLVAKFYEPTQGRIVLDGIDLVDWDTDALRRQIGFVFQDNFLFSASLRENICLGNQASDEDIWQAVEAAQALDFVRSLPQQLETVVGERGVGLSGGERQRIAIARAILRNPRILIFDDSTASLDLRTEASLKKALDRLFAGRTVLIIAQRVSTARSADTIVVLNHGQIEEQGRHQELLELGGIYAQLDRIQNQSFSEKEASHG